MNGNDTFYSSPEVSLTQRSRAGFIPSLEMPRPLSFFFISEEWVWKQRTWPVTSTQLSAGKFPEHILFHSPLIPSRPGPIKARDARVLCLVTSLLLAGMCKGLSSAGKLTRFPAVPAL